MNTHPNELSLALYAGGELDTPERSGVAAHLAICGECRGTIAEIENVRQLLSSAFPEPTHEDLQLVRKTVSDRVKNSRRGRRLWHWDTAVAAVAGVVKICALLLNRKQPDTALKQEPIQLPSIRPYRASSPICPGQPRRNNTDREPEKRTCKQVFVRHCW